MQRANSSQEGAGHERDDHRFTGGAGGTTDDLDYMHARYYSPQVGRFFRFDPIGGVPSAPQSWNRYAYVMSKPLTLVDPLGHFPCPGLEQVECHDSITVVAPAPSDGDLLGDLRLLPGTLAELFEGSPATGFGLLDVRTAQRFFQASFDQAAVEGQHFRAYLLFAVDSLFVPDSQAELGVELAMAVIPGPLDNLAFSGAKGARITGFTRHGINQAISREGVGVSTRAMRDAVASPLKVVSQSGGRTLFVGDDAAVVLNRSGEVITAWARGSSGFRGAP